MKLQDLTAGDIVTVDGGFYCMLQGEHIVKETVGGLYLDCSEGSHFLEGQEDENGELIGIKETA